MSKQIILTNLSFLLQMFRKPVNVSCSITKGNARLVLVINNEIVHDFGLKGMNQNFTLENVTGAVSLRIAGENTGYSIKYELK